jgi:kumamolisin
MSPSRFAATYGLSSRTVRHVLTALWRAGLSATWHPGDDWLDVAGPARRVEATFRVQVHAYADLTGVTFYASPRDPTIPPALRPLVAGASHITNAFVPHILAVPAGGLTPPNLLAAYDITPLRKLGLDGTGATVVFYEIDGFNQANLDAYTRRFHLPPLHPVLKAGPRLAPQGETEMELEVVHAIAPSARLVLYTQDQPAVARSATSDQDFLGALVSLSATP